MEDELAENENVATDAATVFAETVLTSNVLTPTRLARVDDEPDDAIVELCSSTVPLPVKPPVAPAAAIRASASAVVVHASVVPREFTRGNAKH